MPTGEANTRHPQTFNIPLPHNSVRVVSFQNVITDVTILQLTIMHASCQERFKHSIPPQPAIDLYRPAYPPGPDTPNPEPSNCRINITFRFYRPDFKPDSLPRCKCGIPTILRPDMKNIDKGDNYWWCCYAGAQNDGKGCDYWQRLDMRGRGPCMYDCTESSRLAAHRKSNN